MNKKAGLLVRTTFALPVLSCSLSSGAVAAEDASNDRIDTPVALSEQALDGVTAGGFSTAAVGEEGGGWGPFSWSSFTVPALPNVCSNCVYVGPPRPIVNLPVLPTLPDPFAPFEPGTGWAVGSLPELPLPGR